METERLIIRRFTDNDFRQVYEIMKKPEVMYAWEHGFDGEEVRSWLQKQNDRYIKDGYGYFAVVLKETGKIIGQAGLIKTQLNGEEIVELGYIFDDAVWGNGYCNEAAKECICYAFKELGILKVYCTIRPENKPSINAAKRLGMNLTGEFVKIYDGREMSHLIFVLENNKSLEYG